MKSFSSYFFLIQFFHHLYFQKSIVDSEKSKPIDLKMFTSAIEHFEHKSFNQIVTIGSVCLTKFRTKSFLNKYDSQKKIYNVNHLFDWMYLLNYRFFGDALLNDFNDSFGLNHVKVKHNVFGIGAVLTNDKYRFVFNHVFDANDHVSHNRGPKCLTQQSFIENYSSIAEKFDHLIKNSQTSFIGSKQPTLYVSYIFDSLGKSQADFLYLLNAIKSKRDENFLLLVLVSEDVLNQYDYDTILEENLIFHKIKFYQFKLWNSEDSINQWDDILNIVLS